MHNDQTIAGRIGTNSTSPIGALQNSPSFKAEATITPKHREAQEKIHDVHLFEKVSLSPATIVLKTTKEQYYSRLHSVLADTSQDITPYEDPDYTCIKLWRPFKNEVYDTENTNINNIYTIHGLAFNQIFAPNIYHGIALVINFDEQSKNIKLGPIIPKPTEDELEPDESYALLMRFLKQELRLDNQIKHLGFGTQEDMLFLASEISKIHTYEGLGNAPDELRTIDALQKKWELNQRCLSETLRHHTFPSTNLFNEEQICATMNAALEKYQGHFHERCQHIRHCHGDLKTNNLWVLGMANENKGCLSQRRLYAVDCIDFNPALSYIDPLSDVAMLIMDLEEKLTPIKKKSEVQSLLDLFLDEYLRQTLKDPTWSYKEYIYPVMEFYLVEKAIVGAAVSILSDNLPQLGLRYLSIAQSHLENLSHLLKKTQYSYSIANLDHTLSDEEQLQEKPSQGLPQRDTAQPSSPQSSRHDLANLCYSKCNQSA